MNNEIRLSGSEKTEKLKNITNNLNKNEFNIDIKFKTKTEVAKYIRKLYLEKKWLKTSYFKFLVTENFKNFQRIKKLLINRNGLVLCFNEFYEIVCIYFFFLYDNVIYDIIYLFNNNIFNNKNDINEKINELYKNEKLNEECPICKDKFEEGYIKLNCSHVFHKTYIKEWFKINQTCPLCRSDFIDKITKLIKVKEKCDLKNSQNIIFEDKI